MKRRFAYPYSDPNAEVYVASPVIIMVESPSLNESIGDAKTDEYNPNYNLHDGEKPCHFGGVRRVGRHVISSLWNLKKKTRNNKDA